MATIPESVENLLDAVKQLSPDELVQFTARLADRQDSNGENGRSEPFLVRQTQLSLSPAETNRLTALVAKSEQRDTTVEALHLNRPEVLNLRYALTTMGEHPPTDDQQ